MNADSDTDTHDDASAETTGETPNGAREQIRVRLLFFGAAREITGDAEPSLTLPAPATLADLRHALLTRHPALARFGASLLAAVNEEYATPDTPLREGDEVAFFPPVSGGDDKPVDDGEQESEDATGFYKLTRSPLDITTVARHHVPADCGATVTLDGYVREWTRGRRTLYLTYEAYPAMALREMRRIGDEARGRFAVTYVAIAHRTGKLEIGETSVCISVSSPHRRAAFEACEWLITELKRTVPVWKKEFYEGGETWVEGEGAGR